VVEALPLVGPQRGESTIKRCDQAIEVTLSGFQFADIGPQPRHRPNTDNLLALGATTQPHAAAGETIGDVLALVGKDPAEVRRLQRVRRTSRASNAFHSSHRRNLTVPLDRCHSGHIFLRSACRLATVINC
jgi:hypothetical protein